VRAEPLEQVQRDAQVLTRAKSFASAAQRFSIEQFGPRPVKWPLCGEVEAERFGEVRIGGTGGCQQREETGMQGKVRHQSCGGGPVAEAGYRGGGQIWPAGADAGFGVRRDGDQAAEGITGAHSGGSDFAEVGQCALGVAVGQFHLAERDCDEVFERRQGRP
jgi:hypothetical protein